MEIFSLLPSSAGIVCKLVFRQKLVGVSHEWDYPITIKDIPVLRKPIISPVDYSHVIDNSVQNLLKKVSLLIKLIRIY